MDKKLILPLNIHGPVLIYEIAGDNLVPHIAGNKSFCGECLNVNEFNGLDYDDFVSCFGCLNNKNISFKKYEKECLDKDNESINKVKEYYQIAINKQYFDSTSYIAKEYVDVIEKYEEFSKTAKQNKKFYKNPIYLNYRDFVKNHPQIDNPLDIRFNNFYSEELIDDPKRPNVKMVSHFYDANPKVDYDTYKEFIDYSYPLLLKRTKENTNSNVNEIKCEFKIIVNQIKSMLKEHDKVGLVYLFSDREMRYLEKDFKKIDDFTIDDFVKLHYRTIYWFNK